MNSCCAVNQSCLTLCNPIGLQHAYPSPSPRACSNSCTLSRWCHPIISSSFVPFSSIPQSFLASGYFPVSWLFTSDDQSTGASASASDLPVNIQGWFPLGLIGLISLLPKGPSRIFSSTTIWNHQVFGAQTSDSHSHTWLLEKPHLWLYVSLWANWWSLFFVILSVFVTAFLPRNKHFLISCHLYSNIK